VARALATDGFQLACARDLNKKYVGSPSMNGYPAVFRTRNMKAVRKARDTPPQLHGCWYKLVL